MNVQAIFGLQFLLSLVVWSVVAAVFMGPRLGRMSARDALMWLSLPHAFRHVGMVFLVPGMNAQALPASFAVPAAYGDLFAGLLALASIVALRANWRGALALVALFNVVGTLDLANALRHVDIAPSFGATWYIPTMLVPLLLVTHAMMIKRLIALRRA